jgi:hypothetical protein
MDCAVLVSAQYASHGALRAPCSAIAPYEHASFNHIVTSPIIPAIMCGGAGTRLWPVSRESMNVDFGHFTQFRSAVLWHL